MLVIGTKKDEAVPTGDYPKGKLCESDKGGLNIGIATEDDTIILNFAAPMDWIGMGVEDAEGFVAIIQKHIDNIRRKDK